MLYDVDAHEMRRLCHDKESVIHARVGYGVQVMLAITSRWMGDMDPASASVLFWLTARTVFLGREAERITLKQFVEGISDAEMVHAAPIRMSKPTLRRCLTDLCDKDFINIYRTGGTSSGEHDARMFEINFKKVLGKDEVEPRISASLAQVEAQIRAEKASKGVKNFAGGVKNLSRSPIYKDIYNSVVIGSRGLDKSNLFPAGFTAPGLDGPVALGNTMLKLAEPKKPRVVATRVENVRDILSSTRAKSESLRVARAAGAEVKSIAKWEMKDIQAVVDKAMKETRPDYPRMIVTGKAFSVFRKRMKESGLTNVNEFVAWCISFWGIISERNRKAHAKKLGTGAGGTPIPNAPDFTALAYRLPYFIKVYAEGRASIESSTADNDESKEIKALKAQLAEARRENSAKDGMIRRMSSRPVEKPPALKRLSRGDPDVVKDNDDFADDELPAWE